MSDPNQGLWDPDWWKKPRDESLERKEAAVVVASETAQAGDTILIVTEGTVTEPVYFELLLPSLELTQVTVKVMPGRASHPRHVIASAAHEGVEQRNRARRGELGNREPAKFDQVWAVIDTDVAVRENIWLDVAELAKGLGVKLAHSTPCFEYWLILHHERTTRGDLNDGDAAKSALKHLLSRDYSTNRETAREAIGGFIEGWPDATKNAEWVNHYHTDAGTPDPANPSTNVCSLVRALNDTAPRHLRRL